MIAHRIERKLNQSSNPAKLVKYMIAAKGSIDPTSWARTADYVLDTASDTTKGEKVASFRVTNCGTDDPADAAILVLATQAANTRSKTEKTYHFVFSFPPGERPDIEVLHAIEDQLCEAIGLGDHQRVSAVHIDTDHLHVHVAINKVHPTGLQNIEPYFDKRRLMEACERLELKYDLQRTNHGLEARSAKGNAVLLQGDERAGLQRRGEKRVGSLRWPGHGDREAAGEEDSGRRGRVGGKAGDIEAHSGIETLTGYAVRKLAPAMRQANTWQELHDAAAEHGLEVRQRGAGLVIGEPDLAIWTKASNVGRYLSMKALTDRLGLFQPSERQAEGKAKAKANHKRYEPRPRQLEEPTNAGLFTQYNRERQAAILARRQGLEQIKRESAAFNAQVKQWSQTQRMLLKVAGKGPTKRLMHSTNKQQADASRQKNRHSVDARRQALFKQTTMPTWADWLTQQIERGNAEALSVLRDREERTRRWNGELLRAERADNAKAIVLEALKPKARKDGSMAYSTIDGGMVIDRKTHIQAQKATTGAALVALELASKRFEGQALIVEGADEFRLEVAQLAGMHSLKVTFTDPAMEKMRRDMAAHKEMEMAFQAETGLSGKLTSRHSSAEPAQAGPEVAKWIEDRNKKRQDVSSIDQHRLWQSTDAGKATYQGRRRMQDGSEVLLLKRGNEMLVKPSTPRVVAKAATWKLGRTVHLDGRGRFADRANEVEL